MAVKLSKLNPQQREAVTAIEGPVLVVAGAGTGKTRTIAYRTAFMLERGIKPENILCITFTNKASRSMKDRVASLVGAETVKLIPISTIHSLCVRMLREDIHHIGRKNDFTIFDASDQVSFVRSALAEMGLDPAKHDPRSLHFAISQHKNHALAQGEIDRNPLLRELMSRYNAMLVKNNAVDFDDLLVLADKLLEKSAETLEKYRARFHYMMVDEYQDINNVQYSMLKRLALVHRNFYAVGDDDQSIYGWRGAKLEHILNFEKDFKGAKVIKLERNYRSTQQILDAANSVISRNAGRRDKRLTTMHGPGFPVSVLAAGDDREEAASTIERIISEKHKTHFRYCDFAILFRTNAQTRLFEEQLISRGIAYVLVGGTKFYERKEIKDVLSYLRMAANEEDLAAFERVINYPPRGIGGKSADVIYDFAAKEKLTPTQAVFDERLHALVSVKACAGLVSFVKILGDFRRRASEGLLSKAVRRLVDDLDLKNYYIKSYETLTEAQHRFDNVEELVSSVGDYEANNMKPTLVGFLEGASLMTEEKEDDSDLKDDSVAMMTMHSAKGLEFPVVFIVGAEEGLLPHSRSVGTPEEVEEERRLFYVGMTRAMKRLFISWAQSRRKYGETVRCKPSRFLDEIDKTTVECDNPQQLMEDNRQVYNEIANSHLEKMRKMLEGK